MNTVLLSIFVVLSIGIAFINAKSLHEDGHRRTKRQTGSILFTCQKAEPGREFDGNQIVDSIVVRRLVSPSEYGNCEVEYTGYQAQPGCKKGPWERPPPEETFDCSRSDYSSFCSGNQWAQRQGSCNWGTLGRPWG